MVNVQKLTPAQLKEIERMAAENSAEQKAEMAKDMRWRLEEQIQRIVARVHRHTGIKITSVSVDCTGDDVDADGIYKTKVTLDGIPDSIDA